MSIAAGFRFTAFFYSIINPVRIFFGIGKTKGICGSQLIIKLAILIVIKENRKIFIWGYPEMVITLRTGKKMIFKLFFMKHRSALFTFPPQPFRHITLVGRTY